MKFGEWLDELDLWLDSKEDKDLNEIFNKRVPYTDSSKKIVGEWAFSIDNREYLVKAYKEDKSVYKILFTYKKGSVETTSLTNMSKASEVMGMVMNIVNDEIIKKYKPTEIRFEAEIGKRSKLYDRVLNRYFLPMLNGYSLHTEQHEELPLKVYRILKDG
jgi:hypothetical protein